MVGLLKKTRSMTLYYYLGNARSIHFFVGGIHITYIVTRILRVSKSSGYESDDKNL